MTNSNIAAAINAAHANVEAAKQAGVRAAIECGRLLSEAKETVAHGKWDAWVRDHCSFSARTVQLYMRVHRHVGDDPAKAQRVADLPLRALARELAKPKTPKRSVAEFEPFDLECLTEMTIHWLTGKPAWRREFIGHIFANGEISGDERDRAMKSAGNHEQLSRKEALDICASNYQQKIKLNQMDSFVEKMARISGNADDVAAELARRAARERRELSA